MMNDSQEPNKIWEDIKETMKESARTIISVQWFDDECTETLETRSWVN